jgi:hypothetical protein
VIDNEDEYPLQPQAVADTESTTDGMPVADEAGVHAREMDFDGNSPDGHRVPLALSNNGERPPFPDFEPAGRFPIDALPETIQAAVREACKNDQVPGPIAVQSALSAVSLACQDLILVERRPGVRSVASLFMLAVAGSGVRKTQVDKAFLEQIQVSDDAKDAEHQVALEAYESVTRSKKFLANVLRMKLRKLMLKSVPVDPSERANWELDCSTAAEQLREAETAPEKPRLKRLLYSQIAPATLERRLAENWPSAGLFSNEAGDILNARRPEDLSRLDRLWEAQAIDVERPNDKESVYVADPRVTMSLMIQPSVFERFLERKGEQARGIGFLARLLICQPDPLFGKRLIDPAEQRSTYWLEQFNERISALLAISHARADRNEDSRVVMKFSPRAQKIWIDDYNENEKKMGDGGEFAHETDFASRYSEHVARLAALFYFFQEWGGDEDSREIFIPPEYIEKAILVGQWYGQQFRSIFDPRLILERNAQLVRDKLLEMIVGNHPKAWGGEIEAGEFMKRIPEHLRQKDAFRPVRQWLEDNQIIEFYKKEVGPRREYVRFHVHAPEQKKELIPRRTSLHTS